MPRRKPTKDSQVGGEDAKQKTKRPPPPEAEAEMNPETLRNAILRGQLDLPDIQVSHKVVRIYLSSAGPDMLVEREAIATRVVPSLKAFGQDRGFQVQVIDMQMNNYASNDDTHRSSQLNVQQIELCQKMSTGVAFVVFLGQKYGEMVLPAAIDAQEFEAILNVLGSPDKNLMTTWYLLDNNHVPPVFVLRPITEMIPFFTDDDRGKRKDAHNGWTVTSDRLKAILLEGAEKTFSKSNKKALEKYFWSAVDTDIQYGVLKAKSKSDACLYIHRFISDVHKFKDTLVSSYIDTTNGKPDGQARELLDSLKNNKLALSVPKENVMEYCVKWDANGINTKSNREHKKYVDKLCSDLENKWKHMIMKSMEKAEEKEMKERVVLECYNHLYHAKKLISSFSGRGRFLESIEQMLRQQNESGKRQPLVICGPPGCGKSSVMAKLAAVIPQWISNPKTAVVFRSLGLSHSQQSTHKLMTSLCTQLYALLNGKEDEFVPSDDPQQLRKQFLEVLKETTVPLVLLLDGVDELTDNGTELKEWVPAKLPPNITFIMTCLPIGQCEIVSRLKKLLPSQNFLAVPYFDKEDVDSYVSLRLTESKRTLTRDQKRTVSDACYAGKMPLHTKITVEEALRWRSFTPSDETEVTSTLEGTMDLVFDRLEQQHDHTLISRLLGYLTCARNGLSWNEIEDILSLDDVILSSVFRHKQPTVRRFPTSLLVRIHDDLQSYLTEYSADDVTVFAWSHDLLKDAAIIRYLTDDDLRMELHNLLADYFLDKWSGDTQKPYRDQNDKEKEAVRYIMPQTIVFADDMEGTQRPNKRAMTELPHHLIMSDREADLLDCCLTNFNFMYWKLKGTSYDQLLEDYTFAFANGIVHPDISKIIEFLEVAQPALMFEPEQLANQLASRLPAMGARNSTKLTKLHNHACTPAFHCLLTTQETRNQGKSSGELVSKFTGHEAQIEDFQVSTDRTKIISCGSDGYLNVWLVENCRLINQVDINMDDSNDDNQDSQRKCFFCNEDLWGVVIGQDVQVWDLENGTLLRNFEVPEAGDNQILGHMLKNGTTLITVTSNLWVWDVTTGENILLHEVKIDKPKKPAKYLKLDQLDDQLTGFKNTVIFYRKATRGVQMVEFLKTKRNYKKMDILGKKMELNHRVAMTCSPSGLMAYLFYPLTEKFDGQPVTLCVLDVNNIKEINKVFEMSNIGSAIQLGSQKAGIFANGEDEFLFTTIPEESALTIHAWKRETGQKNSKNTQKSSQAVEQLTTIQDALLCVHGLTKGKILAVYGDKPNDIHLVDLEFASEVNKEKQDNNEPEAGPLADTLFCGKRFVYYLTADDKIAVWDLAERRTVRVMAAPFYLPYGTFLSDTKIAAILANQEGSSEDDDSPQLVVADLLEGKVTHPTLASSWKIPNFNFRVHHIANDTIVFPGPEPHQVTAMKISSEKALWTLEVKKTEQIGGLLVSANKGLLLAEVPQTLEQLKEDRENPKERETHLYCFDIQQRRRLADLKVTARGTLSTSLTETQQAVLTPDGKHYASIVDTEDGIKVAVWDATNGKKGWLGTSGDLGEPTKMVYSKAKDCLFLSHAPKSGLKGTITSWTLKSVSEVDRMETNGAAIHMCASIDGHWFAYVTEAQNNVVVLKNFKYGERSCSHYADGEVSALMFAGKTDFLLVSVKDQKGLTQLCLHDSNKQEKLNPSERDDKRDDIDSVERHRLVHLQKENDLFGEHKFIDLTKDENA